MILDVVMKEDTDLREAAKEIRQIRESWKQAFSIGSAAGLSLVPETVSVNW